MDLAPGNVKELGHQVNKDLLIEVKNLDLIVPVFHAADRQLMLNPTRFFSDLYFSRTQRGMTTLLHDISFKLGAGERLGVVGANGAGKSTLLRVIAGIYKPTSGQLAISGTTKGLFDISLGMHPEATGLENIYMRGLHMGLSLSEIRSLVKEVVGFAELEDHIDKPLSTYSTGMRLRLAFSISTMIEPDILLLDEWIGAGDVHFSKKIKARMDGLVEQSRGLVLATHNAGLMKRLCTKALVLDKGQVTFEGEIEDALDFHNTTKKPNQNA